jgi:hypothetical protein
MFSEKGRGVEQEPHANWQPLWTAASLQQISYPARGLLSILALIVALTRSADVACASMSSGPIAQAEQRQPACRNLSKFDSSSLRGDKAADDWLSYRSTQTGLSFRYPSSMDVVEIDPLELSGEERDTQIVDLRGHGLIMRFDCGTEKKTPQIAAARIEELRRAYGKELLISEIEIDGHIALEGCDCIHPACGGPDCWWAVRIAQPRECLIHVMVGSEVPLSDYYPPAHDGTYPLMSIIKTVHFGSARER